MKNKYLVITPFFPLPRHWWGGYVSDQIRAIIDSGEFDEVIVLRTMPVNKCFDYEYDSIKVYGLPSVCMPSNFLTGNPIQKKINRYLLKRKLKQIGVNLDEISYAHLHTFQCAIYGEVLKSKGITTLLQHHDLNPYGINYGNFADKSWHINLLGRYSISAFKDIDCHICISEACKDNLLLFPKVRGGETYESYISKLNKYNGPSPIIHDTYILYNGVKTDVFRPLNHDRVSKNFLIGCIGGFTEIKNQITLIKAIEFIIRDLKILNVRLKIIGTGEKRKECEDYIRIHNLDEYILFEEGCDHEKLVEFYNSINLFCLPSYFEGFGCVFTEAYACGTPFLTCRYQGTDELISSEQKDVFLYAPPLDYKALADKIIKIMQEMPMQGIMKDIDINILIGNYITWLKLHYPSR